MVIDASGSENNLEKFIKEKIETLRPRLLDLSRRNPLISVRLSERSSSCIRVVDELPDVLFDNLKNSQTMRFLPLPSLDDDPKDEESDAFLAALANARLTDPAYLTAMKHLPVDADDLQDQGRKIERTLRDQLREAFRMPPRIYASGALDLAQHAKNNGISPNYELPLSQGEHYNANHFDKNIQTLLLPKVLDRKLNSLHAKGRTWAQETGLNVLHIVYGLLEWKEHESAVTTFSPIILSPVNIQKKAARAGNELWISGTGESPELNGILAERFRADFGIILPQFEGASVEEYLCGLSEIPPQVLKWRVRRQIVIGVFPSARMAMYHDLDTQGRGFSCGSIVTSLLGGGSSADAAPFASDYEVDHPAIEAKVPLVVMDADSSQVSTLADVADGKNIAVEGPPGTGKSQTIVNAIAAAMNSGKKVLFIAEKQAALNVVRSRLDALGLGAFILPLQADRSSQKQVIESIRERLELRTGPADSSYSSKLEAFRQARSEIAHYLSVINQTFASTTLTIREILGRTINSDAYLSDIPHAIREAIELPRECTYGVGLKQLLRLAGALSAAHTRAIHTGDAWKGTQLAHVDRFTREEACELALRTAQGFRDLSEFRAKLPDISLRVDADSRYVAGINICLEQLTTIAPEFPASTLSRLLAGTTAKQLHVFLEQCSDCQAKMVAVAKILVGDPSRELVADVRKVAAICQDANLSTVDISALDQNLAYKIKTLKEMEAILAQLAPFVEAYPESVRWRISDFSKASALVSKTPRRVLLLRHPGVAGAEARLQLLRLAEKGVGLQTRRERLREHISVETGCNVADIANSVEVLRKGGALSGLSASFRRAKRYYLSISRSAGFCKDEAIGRLDALLKWNSEESSFSNDPNAANLFGSHFDGINTAFSDFIELASFYDQADKQFSDIEARQLLRFLKDADVHTLGHLPELPPLSVRWTYREFRALVEQTRREIGELDKASRALKPLIGIFHDPQNVLVGSLGELASRVEGAYLAQQRLQHNETAEGIFGAAFNGWRTDIEFVWPIVQWALNAQPYAIPLTEIIADDNVDAAKSLLRRFQEAQDKITKLLSQLSAKAKMAPGYFLKSNDIESAALLDQAAKTPEGLEAHAEFGRLLREISQYGLARVVEEHLLPAGKLEELTGLVDALASRSLAKAVYAQHGASLVTYTGQRLDKLRSDVAEYDAAIVRLSAGQLTTNLVNSARPPYGNGTGKRNTWTELNLLKNEITKQQRFIPVRSLTERAGRALLELKPCWMMSPLAVAQYIEREKLVFDLCIIDEASQMPPEEALGALLRSRQTMIVGDTNQLPPTAFFKKIADDDDEDEDENEAVLEESILEMANATFRPMRRLRWHYRSRHSGLINFSNRLIYNDDLIVFPSASETRSSMGVEYKYVQGLYKSGTNPNEAEAIVQAAIEFMRNDPHRSLGIVTMNQKQRDLIKERFDHVAMRDARVVNYLENWTQRNDGLEEFFVKNLENVQGDERDVIFIGTVYGPERIGAKPHQRFGPVSGLPGRRRLNVLFSRAKHKIVTFSSMTAADITSDEQSNPGAHMLKRWLEYSATGVLDGGDVELAREPDSEFELAVIAQIRAMGCEPVPQVGVSGYFIDIGVKHPDWPHGFLLGVECDGATYHSAKSARDRDRLRQSVLEGLGWRLHRIWSTDWFQNPRRQAQILREVITARLTELKASEANFHAAPPSSEPAEPSVVVEAEPVAAAETAPKEVDIKAVSANSVRVVEIGDSVRVRFLTGDRDSRVVTISRDAPNTSAGRISHRSPLAIALLGAEEGEEVEVLIGAILRPAVIEKILDDADKERLGLMSYAE